MALISFVHAFHFFPPQGAYNELIAAGITFFDTSDVYGYKSAKAGYSSEQLLGRFAEESAAVRRACFSSCFLVDSVLV